MNHYHQVVVVVDRMSRTSALLFLTFASLLHLKHYGAQAFQISQRDFTKRLQKHSVRIGAVDVQRGDSSAETTGVMAFSKSTKAKPKYYWNDIENVRSSLYEFWECLNATVVSKSEDPPPMRDPPPIPSEALLNHFQRNDLRQVVAKYGGREILSECLGGAYIIPGKWKDAVRESAVVQELVRNPTLGLHPEFPPLSPQQKKAMLREVQLSSDKNTDGGTIQSEALPEIQLVRNTTQKRWSYKNKESRKPLGYWTLPVLVQELYEHLDDVRVKQNRPSVWMPRPSEIRDAGREDLFHALKRVSRGTKTKPKKDIAAIAGLVPYRECHYFDDQLQLMKELTKYLDEHYGGDHTIFPTATEIKEDGYMTLYYTIQRYGGRKFLISRFGMTAAGTTSDTKNRKTLSMFTDLSFGPFCIDFAIDLLEYIRHQHMQLQPPLLTKPATIRMPSEYELFTNERNDLIEGIQKYGGYENVARRLGLDYFNSKPTMPSGNNSPRPPGRRMIFR